MAARSQRGVRTARKNVNYTWSTFVSVPTSLPAGSKVLLGFFFLATAFEETLIRVRGHLSVSSDVASPIEPQQGAFGMIRVTDRARAVGATSIPGPITDGDDDGWFVWQPWSQRDASPVGDAKSFGYTIDSKAQRIVREGQELAVMIESAASPSSEGAIVQVVLRALSRFRS